MLAIAVETAGVEAYRSRILTINGGSSTIKFAVYIGNSAPQQILKGQVEGIRQTRTGTDRDT